MSPDVFMAATEALLDTLIAAARGGIRVTEITINASAFADAVANHSGVGRMGDSFTLDGPTNPVLVRREPIQRFGVFERGRFEVPFPDFRKIGAPYPNWSWAATSFPARPAVRS